MPKLYHQCDPNTPRITTDREPGYSWHFVYLHGEAESRNDQIAHQARFWSDLPDEDENRPWAAPNLFYADEPMPTEPGEYQADHYGVPIVVVIAPFRGTINPQLCGRAAYEHDIDGITHARKPEDWR